MRSRVVIFGLILLMILVGCSGNDEPASQSLERDNSGFVDTNSTNPGAPLPAVPQADIGSQSANQPGTTPSNQNQQRLVIQNATLDLIVEDVRQKVDAIRVLATQENGWVVSANTTNRIGYDDVEYATGTIVIRVSADRFDATLAAITDSGIIETVSETITGEDVTERYVNLNSRLTSKRTSYDQLAILMESATDVQDVLDVQAELERFQTEIEVLEGQIRFLEESAAYSLITVEMSEEIPERPDEEEDEEWKPVEVAKDAFNVLIVTLQLLVNLMIVAIILILPLLLIVGLPSWYIYRRLYPYFQAKLSPTKQPTEDD